MVCFFWLAALATKLRVLNYAPPNNSCKHDRITWEMLFRHTFVFSNVLQICVGNIAAITRNCLFYGLSVRGCSLVGG